MNWTTRSNAAAWWLVYGAPSGLQLDGVRVETGRDQEREPAEEGRMAGPTGVTIVGEEETKLN